MDAEEFTQSLGQIVSGSWRQVALAKRLGVPQALGLTLEDWVATRLGGYVKLSIPDRREAVRNLTDEGHSAREIAEIVGVSPDTAARDVRNLTPQIHDEGAERKRNPEPRQWSNDQLKRKDAAEDGLCVVANLRADAALIAWAQDNDRFVRIDRATAWGNPFEMPDDGGRDHVVAMFGQFYLPHKPSLLARLPTLRGKVLGCWCHPQDCHGRVIAEAVNRRTVEAER
jgi:hypothetical protein